MTEFLEVTIDKFTFKVATDRLYHADHLWLRMEKGLVSVGLTDYLQQIAGDVAFAEPLEVGTQLASGDILGSIETMKTTLDIPSPLSGVIEGVNLKLEDEPELINQAPYGGGWFVQLKPDDWKTVQAALLEPEAYYKHMKAEAEEESQKV